MQKRHKDRLQYFNEQAITTEKYVLPLIEEVIQVEENTSVLEIGCGEGGNLKPFVDKGCKKIVGVDLTESKIEKAKLYFQDHPNKENTEFIYDDIFNRHDLGEFDIIILRDTLEHIHGQEKFMEMAKAFLKPEGKFFLGFPPWWNPFGGHQQMCKSKLLSKLPFYHVLPKFLYRGILKLFGETPKMIDDLMEVKDTRISINRFERIVKRTGYVKERRRFYFINPNYEVKFGLKPRKLSPIIAVIPWIRDLFITTNYYILSKKK